MFKRLQMLGKAFMLPIAILPAAGLLLGIGGALSNPNTINAYPFLDIGWLQSIFAVMSSSGDIVFGSLSLIFAVGLAIGLAKKDKGTAGLAAVVGFLVMNAAIRGMINGFGTDATTSTVLGIETIDTGVFGGILIGLLASYLHNRFNGIQLPQILGFFGGSRFIPIVTSFASIILGALLFFTWPIVQGWISSAGEMIAATGVFGTFVYGFLLRISGAFGLHHLIYPLFWTTELGGVAQVAGETVVGAQSIFFAQLADPTHVGPFFEGTSKYFAGRFATMMFGLVGAALAMYQCAKPSKKKLVGGLMLGAALTSFLTGITEPLEFIFLFVAPWLYVIHAVFDGLSFALADIFNITIGQTFSGGVIDFTLFGILQGNDKTNWLLVLPIGIVWFFLYYFTFKFFIKKFNVMTPGREDDDKEIRVVTKETLNETAIEVYKALGGSENIEDVDACITRLRVSIRDVNKVNKARIKELGAVDVLEVAGGVQCIFGAMADPIKQRILDHMSSRK